MALALERRAVEIGLHRLQQRRVRHRGRRTPPRGLLALVPLLLACLPGVERRARALPRLTHALDPVGAPRGLGERGAHRRDLRIAHAAARSPSTAPRCAASPRRASPPRGRPGGPARRAQDRPRPGPASPPAGRSRRPLPATAPPAIRRAAAAAPRPASGPRSRAAPAPGAPPHLPRRRRALRSPSGLPPSPPTPSPARSSIEPFPPPPWTLDSPLISVQENWGRFSHYMDELVKNQRRDNEHRVSVPRYHILESAEAWMLGRYPAARVRTMGRGVSTVPAEADPRGRATP